MQYKCIRGVVTSQGPVNAGDIVTLPAHEAVVLMAAKKLEIYEAPVAKEEVRVAEAPKVEHRDPVISRGPKRAR
jgi:hypothetical protein